MMDRDFMRYHESIGHEIEAVKDRIRYLIGDAHWQTDGEHKEVVLRKVLRNHVAQTLEIGRGFVCDEDKVSSQIDILVTYRNKPTLFREGETLLVTPDAVAAIIEVKTNLERNLNDVLNKLADNAEIVRNINPNCVVGLFVYEPLNRQDVHMHFLKQIQHSSSGDKSRVINWIAVGPDLFIRYWENGSDVASPVNGPVWHSYEIQSLSHAYFISNVVWDTVPNLDSRVQSAWFPIRGGKEVHRKYYIPLEGGDPEPFNRQEEYQ